MSNCRLFHGDCLDVLRGMGEASVDSVVTDPPAGISFMGREWDHHKGGRDAWIAWMSEVAAECLRVAKPGAHALVWSLPRTSHWTATAWEDAGWTVRDRVSHLFGTGFPKSANISKHIDGMAGAERQSIGLARRSIAEGNTYDRRPHREGKKYANEEYSITTPATDAAKRWQGWGTALKPAVEDWWLLRKPLAEPTIASQVLATGTGALNVDACRVPHVTVEGGTLAQNTHLRASIRGGAGFTPGLGTGDATREEAPNSAGRWPANLCHDGSPEVLAAFAAFGERHAYGSYRASEAKGRKVNTYGEWDGRGQGPVYADTGTAARFFPALGFGEDELRFMYSAKASKADRAGSSHPTVKPQRLLRWLSRLITPPGGTILDPFAGSGSLGTAALAEGFSAVLIEREAEYFEDALRRLTGVVDGDMPLFSDKVA